MIIAIAAALTFLAITDGACAGFRSSVGRSGLIKHRAADLRAARRGAALVAILLTPAVALICADTVPMCPAAIAPYLRAGGAMLAIYAPYAVMVLAALACYASLGWQQRYLAAALVLGPLTLLRPAVAVLGAILAAVAAHDPTAALAAVLAVAAVLATEPIAGRLWYAHPSRLANLH
jgi:hypothetical protein